MKLSEALEWHPQGDGTWEFRRHSDGKLIGWGVRGLRRFHVFDLKGKHGAWDTPLDFMNAAAKVEVRG